MYAVLENNGMHVEYVMDQVMLRVNVIVKDKLLTVMENVVVLVSLMNVVLVMVLVSTGLLNAIVLIM